MTGISSAELGGIGVRHDTYCCGTWNMKEEVAQRNLSDRYITQVDRVFSGGSMHSASRLY